MKNDYMKLNVKFNDQQITKRYNIIYIQIDRQIDGWIDNFPCSTNKII